MIKKKIYGQTLKEQLIASAKDRLYNFSLDGGAVRGVIMNATRMVNEMRANHELGILETLVLGRAYLGGALMTADLKGNDRINLQIECSGPIKGLIVQANAFGEVRGFLQNVPIPIEKPMASFDLSPFFGVGFLSVTRYLEDAKQPFIGKVALEYGNIAKDLANYYLTSQQILSAFNLSIKFDKVGQVTGSGGLFLQAMPGAWEETIMGLEDLVANFPSLGKEFSGDNDPEELVYRVFHKYSPKFLANKRIEFMCHCNAARVRNLLTMLPIEDLKDILENGPFPVESRCHHCNTTYLFSQTDIRKIYGTRFPDN
jgi:molecular chaperone Hsp33